MIGVTYEYLMSSLPHLTFQNTEEEQKRVLSLFRKYAGDSAKELSISQMLDQEAQKFLLGPTLALFRQLDLKNIHQEIFQQSKIKVLAAFSRSNLELKSLIRAWRTPANSEEKKSAKETVENIIGQGSPLEKEIQIMKYQWDTIEELSAGHFTDISGLFAYKIKLLILLRWWSFNRQEGFDQFIQLTAK